MLGYLSCIRFTVVNYVSLGLFVVVSPAFDCVLSVLARKNVSKIASFVLSETLPVNHNSVSQSLIAGVFVQI